MKVWKKAVAVAVAGAAGLAALAAAGYLTGYLGTPSVTSIESRWGNVSAGETELVTSVTVDNPNPFTVKISSLRYTILLNDIPMAEGRDTDVPLKGGTTTVESVSSINMGKIPEWWSSHVSRGETTTIELVYTVKASAGPIHRTKTFHTHYDTVHTDLLSTLQLDQPREITVSVEGRPHHMLTAMDFTARWGNITEETVPITLVVDLYNPHDSPVTADTCSYHFTMNNLAVGHGILTSAVTLPPHTTTSVACTTTITNDELINWFSTHIQNGERTTYEIASTATFTHDGRSYTVEPIHLTGTFHTDILE